MSLYRSCKHGKLRPHLIDDSYRYWASGDDCSGPIEVKVDYEAAARAVYEFHKRTLEVIAEKNEKIMLLPEWDELPKEDREAQINTVRLPIDAALGEAT